MAITTTSLGSNSARIDYDAGTTLANLVSAIDTYITAHGWALYDGSGASVKVYRALNKDGSTYKYADLDYNTSGYLICKVYESWNAVSHSGTNLAYNSDSTSYAQQIYLTNGGMLYIFAHARYLILCSKASNITNVSGYYPNYIGSLVGSSWCGCIEVARDNPEDTVAAGFPCWVWANGTWFGNWISGVSFTRMRDGSTGSTAGQYSFVSNGISVEGYDRTGGGIKPFEVIPSAPNAWSGKTWVFTLHVGKIASQGSLPSYLFPEVRGRLFGIKMLQKSLGNFMDTIQIKCDADFFYDSSSGLVDHWILTENGSNVTNPQGYPMRFSIPK